MCSNSSGTTSSIAVIAVMPSPIAPIGGESWDYSPADDGAQNVVEIVGNAACHGADGLHFLGFTKLGFQHIALGFNAFACGQIKKLHQQVTLSLQKLRQDPVFNPDRLAEAGGLWRCGPAARRHGGSPARQRDWGWHSHSRRDCCCSAGCLRCFPGDGAGGASPDGTVRRV